MNGINPLDSAANKGISSGARGESFLPGLPRAEMRNVPDIPAGSDEAAELIISVHGEVVSLLSESPAFREFVATNELPDPRTAWEAFLERMSDPSFLAQLAAFNQPLHDLIIKEQEKRRRSAEA
jgi:hypothetical protein